ncbi:MAG: cadmium-translocating P-type ATPase [Fusobacteriaceae bacterium]|jgi:Cd2+/Zn2+-exporting ATPase|nr:cadmium-translocating P-type ATPase [Fusobacteriaceae bacterium]
MEKIEIGHQEEQFGCSCGHCHGAEHEHHEEGADFFERHRLPLLIAGAALFLLSLFVKGRFPLYLALSLGAYALLGAGILVAAVMNLKRGNFLDENFLMGIATFGAFYLGEITEAVGVMLFYQIGEYFQDKAVSRAVGSIEGLLSLKAETALVIGVDGTLTETPSEIVPVGSLLAIRAGEKFPIDGVIEKGRGSIDVSALTGESLPRDVETGDTVLSGSVNGNVYLEIRTTRRFSDSTVSKIIEMVRDSSSRKARAEKFITKFARRYTPAVVGLAILVAFGVPAVAGDFPRWFRQGLIFLVISCPCALVISIPLCFFSAVGRASRRGILIKGGNYLEKMCDVDHIIFDKTGTLTRGKFRIDEIEALGGTPEEVIKYAKIGEFHSNHPIAGVIRDYPLPGVEAPSVSDLSDYREIPGRGTGVLWRGAEILTGNQKLMAEAGIPAAETEHPGTVLYVAKEKRLLGIIRISDEIRPDAAAAVAALKAAGLTPWVLTGDNEAISRAIADALGIPGTQVFARLLPAEKVEKLAIIKNQAAKGVVFVGDGINDAPSLSMADVGIAMGGSGADIAIESADVVLMRDEPSKIVELLRIARKNKRVVTQNIVFALSIKLVIMVLGVMGLANMWLAIFADVGVALLAVLNAMRGGKIDREKISVEKKRKA